MASEFTPAPPKVRVTKKQVKQMQKNYQKAAALAEDFSEQEAQEKANEGEKLKKELDDVF